MIVWDLGGVLARFRPAHRLAELSRVSGVGSDHIDRAIWTSGLDARAEVGDLTGNELWDAISTALGNTITWGEIRSAWAIAFEPDLEVLGLVDALGPDRALLTNNGEVVDACLDHELATIGDRFPRRFLSCQLRRTKPDPRVFDEVARALGLRADELTLVDDDAANVAAARGAGWRAIDSPPPGPWGTASTPGTCDQWTGRPTLTGTASQPGETGALDGRGLSSVGGAWPTTSSRIPRFRWTGGRHAAVGLRAFEVVRPGGRTV